MDPNNCVIKRLWCISMSESFPLEVYLLPISDPGQRKILTNHSPTMYMYHRQSVHKQTAEGRSCWSFLLRICFVCVEVLGPNQRNRVMSSAVSLPNHTFMDRLSPLSG